MEASGHTGAGGAFLRGRIVSDGTVVENGVVAYDGDRLVFAGPYPEFSPQGRPEHDVPAGSILVPGLVDMHCHGGFGADFSSADEDAARRAAAFLHRSGTTTLLASTVPAPPAQALAALQVLAGLCADGLLAGIHAEGPFVSTECSGALEPAHLNDPDLELLARLIDAGQGQLRTMTYAPELAGAGELADRLTAHGVIPSIGHTACDSATAATALAQASEGLASAGFDGYSARPTVTHLFNGMPPLHHRSPGPAAACLRAAAAGAAAVELIADGTHLDPQTILTVFELVGAANILLVSDAIAATGLEDGEYGLGGRLVTVAGGRATLAGTDTLAGGTSTLLDVVRTAVGSGVPLPDALASATSVPAAVLGLADEVGSLHAGFRADVLVLTPELRLNAVLRKGRWLA
ncbi:N-acetylglucosamine-6-phosphate deacetylase [Arthrobacter mangrovi]|uniref:N-acetylglucosamine-6-phosphate deacetylase n=1 Tax=Arthrobacter mangrovi TaxID=2966350 RepID=A0ABQ5MSR5_9MICC|nr:amidohydrolase family protein [Arthrobacter mangrovi]GLB66805.1 N-acetylglucosamine-6-phosphate deacetylase [Arthrobacter mangrovi]